MSKPTPSPVNRRPPRYVLRRGTGTTRAVWYLHRGDTDDDCVGVVTGGAPARRAQIEARDRLRRLGVRLIRWEPTGDDEFVAITGITRDAWAVTTYRDARGVLWRRCADDTWTSPAGRCGSARTLDETRGPLTPEQVHNLPALIEELQVFAAMSCYYSGAETCHEGECDGYDEHGNVIDEHGQPVPDRTRCHHVDEHVATSAQAMALGRVLREMNELDRGAADGLANPDQLTADQRARYAGIRDAVEDLRTAARSEDD